MIDHPHAPRRLPVRLSLALIAVPTMLASWALLAQPANHLSEEERVTAIDVLLSFDRSEAAEWARHRRSPRGLEAGDFVVRAAGKDLAVVGVEALEDAAPERAGWTQLVYVDCTMASRAHLEWALAILADRAERLVARGTVEIAVAEPAPQTLLAASTDADLVRATLGQLTRRDGCADLLSQLRDEALAEIEATEGAARTEAVLRARDAERGLVRNSHLALLTRLTDGVRLDGGAQKTLFLVHQGFDPDPDAFYGRFLDQPADGDDEGRPAPAGAPARLVAAYGWTVVGVESRADTRRPGIYIGDWFFFPDHGGNNPEKTAFEEHMDLKVIGGPPIDDGDPWQSFLGGIRGILRENKDADKAESYLELGNALLAQGKFERAADSFEKALYHFADAPRTRDQQIIAMVQLGNALAGEGNRERARRAIEAALAQDPDLADRSGLTSVDLGDRSLAELIDATGGVAVTATDLLDGALDDLDGRTRLTFQIAGDPQGQLLPLQIVHAGGSRIGYPPWTRSATPTEVAVARLQRLTEDELRAGTFDDGEIELGAARREDGTLDLPAALAAAGLREPLLRLTTAPGTAASGLVAPAEHKILESPGPLRIEVPQDAEFLAVLVEDLETGAWGAGLFGR